MLLQIRTLEQLEKEATDIDVYLSTTCSEDANECTQRGCDLMAYLAQTSKMLADAKFRKDEAYKNSIVKELGEKMNITPSVLKMLIEATCKHENYLVNWIDRLNSTITHQLDFLRTIISKAKQEQYHNRQIG